MSEEKAEYQTTAVYGDPFGITDVFAAHLDLSLAGGMHPEEASKAAWAAVQGHIASYSFIDASSKGSDGPSYQMVRKRGTGGEQSSPKLKYCDEPCEDARNRVTCRCLIFGRKSAGGEAVKP